MSCDSRVLRVSSPLARSCRCRRGNPPAPVPITGASSKPRQASTHHPRRWLPEAFTRRPGSLATASPPSPWNSDTRSSAQPRASPLAANAPTTATTATASTIAAARRTCAPSSPSRASHRARTGARTAAAREPDREAPRELPAGALAQRGRDLVGGQERVGEGVGRRQRAADGARGDRRQAGPPPGQEGERDGDGHQQRQEPAARVGEQDRHEDGRQAGARDRSPPARALGAAGEPEQARRGEGGDQREGVPVPDGLGQPGEVAVRSRARRGGSWCRAQGRSGGPLPPRSPARRGAARRAGSRRGRCRAPGRRGRSPAGRRRSTPGPGRRPTRSTAPTRRRGRPSPPGPAGSATPAAPPGPTPARSRRRRGAPRRSSARKAAVVPGPPRPSPGSMPPPPQAISDQPATAAAPMARAVRRRPEPAGTPCRPSGAPLRSAPPWGRAPPILVTGWMPCSDAPPGCSS